MSIKAKGGDGMRKRTGWGILLFVLALFSTALADTLLIEDLAEARNGVTTTSGYVALQIPVMEAVNVSLTVTDSEGRCIYQRDYGRQTVSFRTDSIYLRLNDLETGYLITLTAGPDSYAIPVTREAGLLSNQPACTTGYPLDELTGRGSWQCATMLDLRTLADTPFEAPLIAAGRYACGHIRFELTQGALTASVILAPQGTVDGGQLYIATDALTAAELGRPGFAGSVISLDEACPLGDAVYAVVYADLRVSFPAQSAEPAPPSWLPGQRELWQTIQNETISEAVG